MVSARSAGSATAATAATATAATTTATLGGQIWLGHPLDATASAFALAAAADVAGLADLAATIPMSYLWDVKQLFKSFFVFSVSIFFHV